MRNETWIVDVEKTCNYRGIMIPPCLSQYHVSYSCLKVVGVAKSMAMCNAYALAHVVAIATLWP